MSDTLQDALYDAFQSAAALVLRESGTLASALTSAVGSASVPRASSLSGWSLLPGSGLFGSTLGNVVQSLEGGNSGGGGAGSIISTVLTSGLGLVPLIGKLIGLFGGGGTDPLPKPVKYAPPPAVQLDAALTASGYAGVGMCKGSVGNYRSTSEFDDHYILQVRGRIVHCGGADGE